MLLALFIGFAHASEYLLSQVQSITLQLHHTPTLIISKQNNLCDMTDLCTNKIDTVRCVLTVTTATNRIAFKVIRLQRLIWVASLVALRSWHMCQMHPSSPLLLCGKMHTAPEGDKVTNV